MIKFFGWNLCTKGILSLAYNFPVLARFPLTSHCTPSEALLNHSMNLRVETQASRLCQETRMQRWLK
ncbi:hypothetical protein [Iningainema tapete]|uniref:Uncharacterized protein n=1 Tax=Iningainema tapete BLCC-T55 TaxID=2748662 RepID=A0A8J6XJE7_9CYAN|nr:hypothetical protein [Iningainema tapete]MBD2772594.1 hypothetical protein [Iningainema tapete BLCC-T55]